LAKGAGRNIKGRRMDVEQEGPAELEPHVESYSLFAAMMKWGTVIALVVTALVILAIAS
jgi:hypothetical protein